MKINNIIIKTRVRKDLGDLTSLKKSLETYGLLYPIIINSKNVLITGERRLTAAKELGWEEIDVIVKNISYKDALTLELEENTLRKEFETIELIQGIQKQQALHSNNIFYKIFYFFKNFWSNLFHKK